MGMIGKIVRSLISDSIREIVTEIYDGYTKQSPLILPPGIDSNPIADDQCILYQMDGNGQAYCIGVYPKSLVANIGELRLYSRSSDGTLKAQIYLKSSGKIKLINELTSILTGLNMLIDAISSGVTTGTPTQHTFDAATKALIATAKLEIEKILEV